MAFIRVWVSCAWVWYYEGLLCQVLAIKGEKGELAQILLLLPQVVIINVHRCQNKMFDPISVTYVCDL